MSHTIDGKRATRSETFNNANVADSADMLGGRVSSYFALATHTGHTTNYYQAIVKILSTWVATICQTNHLSSNDYNDWN